VMYHRLLFRCIPKPMVKYGAMECVRWLNMFLLKGGVNEFYSPHVIMAGKPLDYG